MLDLLKQLEQWLDQKLAYFMFNGNKQHRYQAYLHKKYNKTPQKNQRAIMTSNNAIPIKFGI